MNGPTLFEDPLMRIFISHLFLTPFCNRLFSYGVNLSAKISHVLLILSFQTLGSYANCPLSISTWISYFCLKLNMSQTELLPKSAPNLSNHCQSPEDGISTMGFGFVPLLCCPQPSHPHSFLDFSKTLLTVLHAF